MIPVVHVPMNTASLVSVQVRAEERQRVSDSGSIFESEVNPMLRYDMIGRHFEDHIAALYNPHFISPFVLKRPPGTDLKEGSSSATVLHSFAFAAELSRRRYKLSLTEYGSLGDTTTTALLFQKPWAGEGLPVRPAAVVTVGPAFTLLFSQTQLAVPLLLTRRLTLTPSVSYNAFGGANTESKDVLPMVHGPGGSVILEYKASRHDALRVLTGGGYQNILFATRTGDPLFRQESEVRLQHQHSRKFASEWATGYIVAGDVRAGAMLFPTSEVAGVYTLSTNARGASTRFAAVGRVTPWLNLFSLEFEQRADITLAANMVVDKTTFRVQGTAGRAVFNIDSVSKYSLYVAEAGVSYALHKFWNVEGGARGAMQSSENALRADDVRQAIFYLALQYAPQNWRL